MLTEELENGLGLTGSPVPGGEEPPGTNGGEQPLEAPTASARRQEHRMGCSWDMALKCLRVVGT